MNKRKNIPLTAGLIGITLLLLLTFWGIIRPPYDPEQMDAAIRLQGMSTSHLLGTDQFGRDLFSRILVGLRTTLVVAFFTNLIGSVLGTLIGALTGYYGGIVDELLMRFNDAVLSFPSVLLALVFIALWGSGTYRITVAMGIVFAPSYARIVRSEFLKQKSFDYVASVRLQGGRDLRIMFIHILPNILPTLTASWIIGFNNAVLCEAAMSFLGIGVQPPQASLGSMLSDAQSYLFLSPSYALFTGAFMVALILFVSLIGDGYRKGGRHA